MIKTSSVDPTQQTDESGRKILIATGPRLYFRKDLSTPDNDFNEYRNTELNEFIAADVAGSENIRSFAASSSSVADAAQEQVMLKKSKQYGFYYVCILSKSELRVVKIQKEIKTGIQKKYGSKVETGITDPTSGKQIRVTSTARKEFRDLYKETAFPPNTSRTFANADILELSKYIANLYASRPDGRKHIWKNENVPETETSGGVLEIRLMGSNRYLVASIKENFVDIISLQGGMMAKRDKQVYKKNTERSLSKMKEYEKTRKR